MDDEIILEEEDLGTDVNEDTDVVDADADTATDPEEEFEYDEDGNIIIPDVVEDEEEEDVADNEGETEDGKEGEDSKLEAEVAEPTAEKDATNEELEALKKELAAYKSQTKDTLAKLGVNTEDALEGLASLAAEADGITTEEYLKRKTQAEQDEKARALLRTAEFEKMARADLAELQAVFPETQSYKDIRDMPKDILKEFGKYRDMGLSPKAAYAAANPDGIRNNVATAVKKQSLHDTKTHLQSSVPKGSKDNSIKMTKKDLEYWRGIFPNRSDKEIAKLYKESMK